MRGAVRGVVLPVVPNGWRRDANQWPGVGLCAALSIAEEALRVAAWVIEADRDRQRLVAANGELVRMRQAPVVDTYHADRVGEAMVRLVLQARDEASLYPGGILPDPAPNTFARGVVRLSRRFRLRCRVGPRFSGVTLMELYELHRAGTLTGPWSAFFSAPELVPYLNWYGAADGVSLIALAHLYQLDDETHARIPLEEHWVCDDGEEATALP